jgi:hypothetical protein
MAMATKIKGQDANGSNSKGLSHMVAVVEYVEQEDLQV